MRVSTYFAPTLPQAMAHVREALGPKAVVLSWRNVRGGVEITASIGNPDHAAERPAPAPLAELPREDRLADHFSPDDFGPREAWLPKPPKPREPAKPRAQERGLGALINRTSGQPIGPKEPPPQATQPAPVIEPTQGPERQTPSIPRVGAFLMRAGLSAKQAIGFGVSPSPNVRRGLIETLTRALRYEPVEAIPTKPLLLVGPPGAGKSAVAAKLAARTLAAGHEVVLISADAERCGGADQLQALAKRLGARFQKVTTLADLNELIGEARGRGMVVYVDAPAACPAQSADMRAISRMIDETRLEPVLCLPADMRPDDMEELAQAYGDMGVKRAIATRFDLTRRRASILHVLKATDMALAQVSATPYISGGVAIATPTRVADLMLEPFEDALAEDAA
jgi:flagellar biosynthesis protein FlhF